MQNTNITVSLDTRRQKKDGSYPVIMRLGHNARTTAITVGFSVLQKDWDDDKKAVRKSYSGTASVSRLNNLLQKKKAEAMDVILKLHESGVLNTLSVSALRDRIDRKDFTNSFFSYAEKQIEDLIKASRIGTARCYKGVVAILKTHTRGHDLKFQDISYAFLMTLETSHHSKGNGANGLSVYMRTIRAIFNKAIKEGLVDKELYPFANYKIKSAPTEKRALEWSLLKSIIDLKLDPAHACFHARNYFLASYLMYGMNFTDMAYLRLTDIKDGRISYRRKKTAKLYDVKISENLKFILDQYIQDTSEYVFPILKRETAYLQGKDIQWARKRYNGRLKEIGKLCGIDQPLTSYVSRHSFATQAMLKQIPLNAISAMLGHSSLKTTEVYLKGLPSNVMDDYNRHITGLD
ncbi:MAG: site-specific integrase [Williamsia sp.]|nr:site-specific integrase [Williamsia sp.]